MTQVKVGVIGGSGLGDALCAQTGGERRIVETPFGAPSDAIIETRWGDVDVAVLNRHGPGRLIAPSAVNYRANIYALKAIGCTHVIAGCAVGSLREEIEPRHLVIPDQIIDKTHQRSGSFFHGVLAAHVEMANPFCPVLRKHLLNCAADVETTVHNRGTYICMEGPAFSTRAESEMHRLWGGDLIGMPMMPEAKLAREAELAYAAVALASDYDCWRPHPDDLDRHELLKEIISHLTAATANAIALIKAAVERFGEIADIASPAHIALELGIWSDRSKIDPAVRETLNVLVAKYL